MLKNVKSLYFIQKLFSYICEKNKLQLVKYNKNLQIIIDISIINYEHFSGRYIIYEQNGKGKEYEYFDQQQILIFEGEYLNGKRNGKGKEYYGNGGLKFEGEYLNNKRNGKGKFYEYMNSNLIFDCEYLNGNRHGYGKEFYDNGNLEFKGEYLNGERNGKGKQYYKNGNLKFEGEFINDEIIADTKYDKNGNIIYQYNNSNKIRKTFDFYSGNLIFEG